MIETLLGLPPGFVLRLLAGVLVDFQIAGMALGFGLTLGLPLAFGWASPSRLRVVPNVVVQAMRAAPTFVVMFFLINVVPREVTLFGWPVSISGELAVALSLLPYSASYIAENGAEALRQWRAGSQIAALLFLPNVARAFFVLVMSSGAAAAIGVTEGISVILRQADRLPSLPDRLRLFAFGLIVFGATLQSGFLIVLAARRRLADFVVHHQQHGDLMNGRHHQDV